MKAIENREDISLLVHSFYDKIRENELLGPIFNQHITNEAWPTHLSMLTDFWEMNLLGSGFFSGRPGFKHKMVDRNLNHTIDQHHFEQWLSLWFITVDELFDGEIAKAAKTKALRIGQAQFHMIQSARQR